MPSHTHHVATILATFICLTYAASAQQEVGFIEDFALTQDREKALTQLIPGTEDYYYYHALHFQNTEQKAKYSEILTQWAKRFQTSGRRVVIERRQALLDYDKNPKASLEYIRRELGLNFNHQQEGKAQEQEFPSKLNQADITWKKFLKQALDRNTRLGGLTNEAFYPLLKSGQKLSVVERRDLLSRAQLPDLPGLVPLIVADFGTKESRGFGEFKIHRALTIAQLDELAKLRPDLLRTEKYVHAYLTKLRPGADSDPVADVAAREAYLTKAWAFVEKLTPSFNSLKAHILYQRLQHDRSIGTRNAARFLTYVKLPRNSPYIRPEWRRDQKELWRNAADCNREFGPVTGLPPIGRDELLVRDYLLHFFKDAKDFNVYAPYISESWLKAVFAEAKIVNGIGDPERWTSMLNPAAFQALKDRVDLEFDPTHQAAPAKNGKPRPNAEQFGIKDPVKLRLHVKNIPKLIVKVFELNPINHYLEKGTELSTDVNLDGLVANIERTIEYDAAPARRIVRDFEFPEIENRRGVWVVEFIGGGRSSRAMIRKGKLEILSQTVSKGIMVTVLDESHTPAANGAVWFGGRRVECDKKGRALIPFSTNPGNRSLVVEDGSGFASLGQISHPAENYHLRAGFHVEREALRPGARAKIAVRPLLTLAGQPVSLSHLSDVRLILSSRDLDGIETATTIAEFEIASDRESIHEFRVPDRLQNITAQLTAKTKLASQGGVETELSCQKTFSINSQMRTEKVDGIFLSRIGGSYILELLGRNGEARTGRNVNVQLIRPGFTQPLTFTLKTTAAGIIDLGPLNGIQYVKAQGPGGEPQSWGLPQNQRSQQAVVHAMVGDPIQIPYLGKLDRAEVALLSTTAGTYVEDHFKKLALQNGFLVAKGLAPGDYILQLKQTSQAITFRIAAGDKSVGYVFNPTRTLELDERSPAHLVDLKTDKDSVLINVANGDKLTRVHVMATRFLPEFNLYHRLGYSGQPGLYSGQPARLPNLFLSGRKIGDEFRYILERRYAQKLPGNLLERPELLLNPWAVRETDAGKELLAEGEEYSRKFPGRNGRGGGGGASDPFSDGGGAGGALGRSFDFLSNDPVTIWNLRPDKNGKMKINLDAFGDRQHIHVLVVDPSGATYRDLSLADRGTELRDLRLLNALDPKEHFTEQDSVTLMKKGDTLKIPDILTARFETFEDLGSAYRYLLTLQNDPVLRQFSFITEWPKLDADKKKELYSRYASHELSFFLSRKDPKFFKAVVAPHLANKKDRTFMDDYLLGNDLISYFEAFEYARLNVPERILLARSVKDRIDGIRLDLRDRISLIPPDLGRETTLFESALASFGMSGERKRELDMAVTKGLLTDSLQMELSDKAADSPNLPSSRMRNQLGNVNDSKDSPKKMLKMEKMEELQEMKKLLQEEATEEAEAEYSPSMKNGEADPFGDDSGLLPGMSDFFREIETTKEWAENNYYQLPIGAQTYDLITENKFWQDFANHEGENGFGSRHLGEAASSFHEAMLALAVIDLPFEAVEHELEIEGTELDFKAAGRVIAFHREIKPAEMAKAQVPLLVSQSYFRNDDRFRMEGGEKFDKFVTDEFVAGVVYGSQVVVTNPTSSRQKLDVLVQIPKGAMPVLGKRATDTQRITLKPYTTQRFEVFFYFPTTGNFPCYPAHVSKAGKVMAHAEAFTCKVVDKLSKVDETSWAYISQWGTPKQVLEYLATQNLHAIDLNLVAWRCRENKDFTLKAVNALNQRGIYHATIFSYGIMHNLAPAVRQFLLMQESFLNGCGLYLKSALVTIDPIERRAYQHLEYKPLVNNRAHRVGADHRILNNRIRGQYQQFLKILSEKASLDDMDKMSTTYYLFLQDRAQEALAQLDAVNAKALPTQMQYDYLKAYAAFYRSKPAEARKIAASYADYSVDRWRERFAAVRAQADEIAGAAPKVNDDENRDQQQAALAAKEQAIELKVDGTKVTLDYQNLKSVQVNYYEMDLEFLFSTTPFVSNDGGGFSIVKPNRTETVRLPADKRAHTFALPNEYQSKNVLVEVVGGGKRRSEAIYANELQALVSENFGILTVRHDKDGRALPKVYVKVYVMTEDGPQFYKDGYTDLRGKFDYATVSTTDIANATKFSILVMSEDHGATVLEAPVPQR
ncbi:MAG: hypothetical protein AB8D78_05385 [Akkermansiaceae bacterium]